MRDTGTSSHFVLNSTFRARVGGVHYCQGRRTADLSGEAFETLGKFRNRLNQPKIILFFIAIEWLDIKWIFHRWRIDSHGWNSGYAILYNGDPWEIDSHWWKSMEVQPGVSHTSLAFFCPRLRIFWAGWGEQVSMPPLAAAMIFLKLKIMSIPINLLLRVIW